MMAFMYSRPPPVPQMPPGLRELMEDLTRQVLLESPSDVHAFCASHMRKLLDIRDGPPKTRTLTLEEKIRRAQKIVKQRAEQRRKRLNGKKIDSIEKSENGKLVEDTFSESVQASVTTERQLKYQLELELFPEDTEIFKPPIILKHIESLAIEEKGIVIETNYPDKPKDSNASEKKTQDISLLQDVKSLEVLESKVEKKCEGKKEEIFETNQYLAPDTDALTEENKEQNIKNENNESSVLEGETELKQNELLDNNENNNYSVAGMKNEKINEESLGTEKHNISDIEPPFEIEVQNQTNNDKDLQINLVNKENDGSNKTDNIKDTRHIGIKDNECYQNVGTDPAEKLLTKTVENVKSHFVDSEIIFSENEPKKPVENSQKQTGDEEEKMGDTSVLQVDPELSTNPEIEVDLLLNNAVDDPLSSEIESNTHPPSEQNEKGLPVTKCLESGQTEDQNLESVLDHELVEDKGVTIEENKVANDVNPSISSHLHNDDTFSEKIHQSHQITNKDVENPVNDIVNESLELKLPISQTSDDHNIVLDGVADKSQKSEDLLISSGMFEHFMNENTSNANTDEAGHTDDIGVDDTEHMTHEYETHNIGHAAMDLETAAITIQKVFRSFLFKSRNSTFDDAASDESTILDKDVIREGDSEYTTIHEINKDRRLIGLNRMDTVLQTVNEEKSLSLSTDDSSTLSSAATTIQAHVRGFLVRNKLDSYKTGSKNSLANSNPDSTDDQPKNKTVLNIHIVPDGGQFVSRDDSLLASMDMSMYGSPSTSADLHPLGHDISERRKQLKREDAIQSVSPPSNNSGKLSEDIDSVKDMTIVNSEVIKQQSTDDTLVNKTEDLQQNFKSHETTPTHSVTEDTVKTAIEVKKEESLTEARSDTPPKTHFDEMDVVTPSNDNESTDKGDSKLLHSGEFHDAVLPTKVSRKDTSVIRGE